jgi:hypothetical protein
MVEPQENGTSVELEGVRCGDLGAPKHDCRPEELVVDEFVGGPQRNRSRRHTEMI